SGGDVTETIIGPPGDFPVIPAAKQGRRYGHGWMSSMNPDSQGPPLFAGPVGVSFNSSVRSDGMDTGAPHVSQASPSPPQAGYNEPVHVPAKDPAHDGWSVMIVDRQVGDNSFVHEAWVVDAGNLAAGAWMVGAAGATGRGGGVTRIVITGASGNYGQGVTDRLIAQGRGADSISITRKPEKSAHRAAQGCTVRYGDFDSPETSAGAVVGADRMSSISGTWVGARVEQHRAAIAAAASAGVRQIVYTSFVGIDDPANPAEVRHDHIETERLIRA
ncbi:hypothetical protein OY671_008355, partial [Metschnikowia pulcherrima]